jgi:hypothetical protein
MKVKFLSSLTKEDMNDLCCEPGFQIDSEYWVEDYEVEYQLSFDTPEYYIVGGNELYKRVSKYVRNFTNEDLDEEIIFFSRIYDVDVFGS